MARRGWVLALAALWLAACSRAGPGTAPAPQPIKLSVAYHSSPAIGDVTSLVAWDLLKDKGYDVTVQFLNGPDLVVQAIDKGEVQVGIFSTPTGFQAALVGSDIRLFLGHKRNEWTLSALTSIPTVKDLDGKRVAIGTGSVSRALIKWTEKQYSVKFNLLTIANSQTRAQALLAGQLEGAFIDISDATTLLTKEPGKFHVLLAYAELFPKLDTNSFFAPLKWIKNNPKVVEDIVITNLEVRRKSKENPSWLVGLAQKKFSQIEPALVEKIVKAYIDRNIWDLNGNVDKDVAEFTIKFYADEAGSINVPPDKRSMETFYAVEPVERVLAKVGRR